MNVKDNIFEFDNLSNPDDDEDGKWEEFCDSLKEDVFRGAYFIVKNDGTVRVGCTEQDKVGQERMLLKLKSVIEYYIETSPDYELMEAILKNAKDKNIKIENEDLVDFDEEDF